VAIKVLVLQVGGITLPIMEEALLQAREGRKHILGKFKVGTH
jgi:polyribonucleotide nucleotidyltransferase